MEDSQKKQKRAFVVKNEMKDTAPAAAVQQWAFDAVNKILEGYWHEINNSESPPQIGLSIVHKCPAIVVPGCTNAGTYQLESYVLADDMRAEEATVQ